MYRHIEVALTAVDATSTRPLTLQNANIMIYEKADERLDYLIKSLMQDVPQARGLVVPTETDEKRRLLRALMNVRPPLPATPEFLTAQDEELQIQLREKGIVEPSAEGITLWQGDITRLRTDAIVNAANSQMLGCFVPLHGCIDNAIHSAAGIQLRQACHDIMQRQGHDEPTGQAKLTPAYNLPSRYVIHTVGPIVRGSAPSADDRRLLADCYRNCLSLADETGLHSIAFCCISTGEFHFPNAQASEIAVDVVRRYLSSAKHLRSVVFNVFKDADREIYEKLLS